MSIQPVFNHFATRPKTASARNRLVNNHSMIRDQFSLFTWLIFGALIQGFAHILLPYRNIVLVLPVFMALLYKMVNTLLQISGVLPNPLMKEVLPYRTGLVFPNEKGTQETPGDVPICAILLSAVSNHPLGMLGPGWKRVGDSFDDMIDELSADATKYGFLGASSWTNAGHRTSGNEVANILYFENEEHMHAYAHGALHTKTMQWWHENASQLKHIGIMHEVFVCPKKSWEGVYLNYFPTGLGSTTKEVIAADGKTTWVSPLVRAKGKLLYSKGRMGRVLPEKEWEAFREAVKDEEYA